MNELFFALVRVSLGTEACLPHTPSAEEWKELYCMAKKHSLLGICFAGVQKLQRQQQCPHEDLYVKWLGMAAKIQMRNKVMDRQCAGLHAKLYADRFRSCILKGQGVGQLYAKHLLGLRQSGDIDIWVEGDKDEALNWARRQGANIGNIDVVHAHADFYEDTEVEIHSQPSWMYGRKADKTLQKFFAEKADEQFRNLDEKVGYAHPTVGFNLVYLLVHINRHIFEEGIGFRQLMDYYFALSASNQVERTEAVNVLSQIGLMKFAQGVMYIEQKVFGLDDTLLLCEADKSEGNFLLKDILIGGNFGKYDERTEVYAINERWKRGWFSIKHNLRYLVHYPSEVITIPFWKLWHYCWRKKKGYL